MVCFSSTNLPTAWAPPVYELWTILSPKLSTSIPQSSGQGSQQVLIILADALLRHAQFANPPASMDHGGVISAAESIADFREAVRRQFFRERHRDLARPRDGTTAAF